MYEIPDSDRSKSELDMEYLAIMGNKRRIEEHIIVFKGWLYFFLTVAIIGAIGTGAGVWMLSDELQQSSSSGSWFLDYGLSILLGCGGLLLLGMGVWMALDLRNALKEERSRLPGVQQRLGEIDSELTRRLEV